jgi:hypothetical protein
MFRFPTEFAFNKRALYILSLDFCPVTVSREFAEFSPKMHRDDAEVI